MISLYISAESGRRTEKNIFTKYIKGKCEHPVSAGGPLKLCNHFGAFSLEKYKMAEHQSSTD